MTVITVRARYEDGHLIPTTPLNLVNGAEVVINITPESERDRVRAALAEIAILPDPSYDQDAELEDLIDEIFAPFANPDRPIADDISEDRGRFERLFL